MTRRTTATTWNAAARSSAISDPGSGGIYVNMLNVDETDRLVEAYGGPEKYARAVRR